MRTTATTRMSLSAFVCAVAFTWLAVEAGDRTAEFQVELSDPVAPTLPPRLYRVVQSTDENGFPTGYALTFTTHVCVDEQCRMVKVTMHWDALGYYERLEYPADTPLTKKKHVPFAAEDYAKLDQILKDRDSILGSQPLEIFGAPVQQPEVPGIDGWSGATPQAVKDAVVDDAAYTSWTMWRWANGEIVPKLQSLTEQRCTPDHLRHLLQSNDRRAVDLALKYITRHRPSDERFADDVFHVLETGDREPVSLSIQFLHRAMKDKRQLHDRRRGLNRERDAISNADIAAAGRQLMEEIERGRWRDRYLQHVTDEPIRANAADYRIFVGMVRKYMPGIPILDATMDTTMAGSVDIWCPQAPEYQRHRDTFEAVRAAGDRVWFYTCCFPGGPWLNRLLDMELLRPALFGWAAARFDDLINLPCSRLTGVLFAASQGRRFGDIIDVMRRDAPKHQSPNAGWPEAAMAARVDRAKEIIAALDKFVGPAERHDDMTLITVRVTG